MAILRTRQAFGRRRDRDTARDNNVSGTTACAKSLAKLCRLLRRVRAILHTLRACDSMRPEFGIRNACAPTGAHA
jgi:hypothetical protein